LAGNTFGINAQATCPTLDADDADDFAEVHGPSLFLKTPAANKLLLDFSQECLAKNFCRIDHGTFLLWVSLSSLDMLGHKYGPDSLEIIDMIYHLDKQLAGFMKFCQKQAGPRDTLFVLTADHGVDAIPEILQRKGMSLAQRILAKPLMKKMNAYLQKKYGIQKAGAYFKVNQFYLNTKTVPVDKKAEILQVLKKYLLNQSGIKKVWTRDELLSTYYRPDELECLFKNQCHPLRSGDLICMVQPFCPLTKHDTGTAHRTPYNHDTHVPLIFYQEGRCKPRRIQEKVWVPQLPVTLAHIMGITKPSAARYGPLPCA
jgi:predicted AlkP superfamily pyrophosphatase or phosphodiesterase